MFDIGPYVAAGDPWLAVEDPELVVRLYGEKHHVAALLRPRSIVEIGVRAGYSAAAFLAAVPGCSYLGIDADVGHSGGWPGALEKAEAMLLNHFGDRARLLKLNTRELETLPCGAVDLVHVDGDHSYAGCLHDLELAAGVGRWLLVDDIEWENSVRAAATAFVSQGGYRAIELPTVRGDLLIEVKGVERTYSHGGDTGDLIYALASVKMMGGGRMRLVKAGHPREPFSPAKVESLRRFLEAQPYISGVEYGETAVGMNLDHWRNYYRNDLSLCDMVASAFGLPHYPRNEPWLFCAQPNRVAPVVIARSARCHGNNFPWRRVRELYHAQAIFVGLSEEHAAWEKEFGTICYHPTADWWELCRVIAGAEIFIGNQSAPMALALGLCVPRIVQEVHLPWPNCQIERPGVVYGRNSDVELPELPVVFCDRKS
jgi:hypothetical protein